MKLLLDTCVWGGASQELEAAGHDVLWAGEWTEDPGDEEILARAHSEERILVTLDKDFGELAIVHRMPHSGIFASGEPGGQTAGYSLLACARPLWRGTTVRGDCNRRVGSAQNPSNGHRNVKQYSTCGWLNDCGGAIVPPMANAVGEAALSDNDLPLTSNGIPILSALPT